LGTKLVIDEGVTPVKVIGVTMRAGPDGPGVQPRTAAGRTLALGWRRAESE
jgi:hypothetical protein